VAQDLHLVVTIEITVIIANQIEDPHQDLKKTEERIHMKEKIKMNILKEYYLRLILNKKLNHQITTENIPYQSPEKKMIF